MNRFEPLLDIQRAGFSESVHQGAVVVTNKTGEVVASVGDPEQLVFSRSSLKPFQAIPLLMQARSEAFALTDQHVALMCASHSGEPMHVNGVDEMLKIIGQPVSALRCGCHVPYHYTFFGKAPPEGAEFNERFNNCSGKHTGFLASCIANGWPTHNYIDPTHPLQRAVAHVLKTITHVSDEQMPVGIDGCSAPAFALPLRAVAAAYVTLGTDRSGPYAPALERTCKAMIQYPEYVSGTGRNDDALMRIGRGDWISKVGADGIQAIASISRAEGIALKVGDGNGDMRYAVTVEAMEQRGWLDDVQREQLAKWRFTEIRNAAGLLTGVRKPIFRL